MSTQNDNTLKMLHESLTILVERDKHYIKERAEHIRDVARMNTAIEALTKSNEKVNESITELIAQTRLGEHKTDVLKELILSKDSEHKSSITDLDRRLVIIERVNAETAGERRRDERNGRFWSENWFKFLQLFAVLVTIGAVMYATFKP